MVISIGHLKSCQYHLVYADILAVVKAAHPVPVKVIIETVFLSPEEIIAASFISAEANAAFVKTSTGFSGGGATKEDVELMKRTVQYKGDGVVKVKASAGVRTWDKSIEVLNAGADRIGTYVLFNFLNLNSTLTETNAFRSSGVAIMENRQGSGY
jgi:deoxyribose-phosphate aldolase